MKTLLALTATAALMALSNPAFAGHRHKGHFAYRAQIYKVAVQPPYVAPVAAVKAAAPTNDALPATAEQSNTVSTPTAPEEPSA